MNTYIANNLKSTVTIGTTLKNYNFTGCTLINLEATPSYLQIFDTTGSVTLGTTVPSLVIPIAANATPANGSCNNVFLPKELWLLCRSGTLQAAVTTAATGNTVITTGLSGTIFFNGN
jgi:hypothetical protein